MSSDTPDGSVSNIGAAFSTSVMSGVRSSLLNEWFRTFSCSRCRESKTAAELIVADVLVSFSLWFKWNILLAWLRKQWIQFACKANKTSTFFHTAYSWCSYSNVWCSITESYKKKRYCACKIFNMFVGLWLVKVKLECKWHKWQICITNWTKFCIYNWWFLMAFLCT